MESPSDSKGNPWDGDSMARAVIALGFEMFEERGKYALVSQNKNDSKDKLLLNIYTTEKQAITDARAMAYINMSKEYYRSWVVPCKYQTAAALGKDHKKARVAAEKTREEATFERGVPYCRQPGEDPALYIGGKFDNVAADNIARTAAFKGCGELYLDEELELKECMLPAGHSEEHRGIDPTHDKD